MLRERAGSQGKKKGTQTVEECQARVPTLETGQELLRICHGVAQGERQKYNLALSTRAMWMVDGWANQNWGNVGKPRGQRLVGSRPTRTDTSEPDPTFCPRPPIAFLDHSHESRGLSR